MGTLNSTRQSVGVADTHGDGATSDVGVAREGQTTQLRYALASATGSWGREFRLLLTLADGRGVSLDAEALAFYDVRDLQALQRHLVAAHVSQRKLVVSR